MDGEWEHLVGGEPSWMRRLAGRLLGRRLQRLYDSTDLVQSTLRRVLPDLERLPFRDSAHRRRWVARALVHGARARGRSFRAQLGETALQALPCGAPHPSRAMIAREQTELVRCALECLPVRLRSVVSLRVQEGLSFADVAQQLGIREDHARQVYRRALAQLEHSLRRDERP